MTDALTEERWEPTDWLPVLMRYAVAPMELTSSTVDRRIIRKILAGDQVKRDHAHAIATRFAALTLMPVPHAEALLFRRLQ